MNKFVFVLVSATLLPAQVIPNRYIVELSGEPAVTTHWNRKMARSAIALRRQAVLQEQSSMRVALADVQARVLESVATVANALIVQVPDAQVDQLRRLPGVLKVHKVYRCKLRLNQALNLTHSQDGWDQVGGFANAGAGMKVGLIDTGIDPTNAGFIDDSLTPPPGYPIYSGKDLPAFHSLKKVIVARSYGAIAGGADTGPADLDGHGSGTAMAAIGNLTSGPLASIAGSAPKAFLGVYRLDPDLSTDAILKAFDDAVNDGMDVVNISIGIDLPLKIDADPLYDAVERAAAAGLIIVSAAGNGGPQPDSLGPPATAPDVIAVGMTTNNRTFSGAVLAGDKTFVARPGNTTYSQDAISGPLVSITSFDATSKACSPLPASSLNGKVALILRGDCNFSTKIQNAATAGATAAIIYATPASPDLFSMDVSGVTLPAASISYADGTALLGLLTSGELNITLRFTIGPVPITPSTLVAASSRGPDPQQAIKPEVLAVGEPIYTAAQTLNPTGESYNATGYILTAGTSFASPLVAGIAAMVKQAHPGLTVAQYRSLVINTATPLYGDDGKPLRVQEQGAGLINAFDATRSKIALEPATMSFGTTTSSTVDSTLTLKVTNLSTTSDTFFINVEPRDQGPAPTLGADSLQLDGGASASVAVRFTASDLTSGEYQGYVVVRGTQTDLITRVPYWFAVPGAPKYIPLLLTPTTSRRAGSTDTFYFQVLDANGIGLPDSQPEVTTDTTGASVRSVVPDEVEVPGGFEVSVRYSRTPGVNNFTVKAGDITATVSVSTL
ncbi:MAG: S8 family serine peptidase [Bryobacterales bacterium]|nr:S8 family serine peptidase [Bryobacterales bacterium]